MSAAVVRREEFDVLVQFPSVDLVLDSVVREVHLAVEERQVVLARPAADFALVATGSTVAVGAVAVVMLQELLVLAFKILFEDDAADLEIRMLVSEAGFLLAVRRVEIRTVVDLARATDAGVERLLGSTVALQGVRVEQIASLFGEGQVAFVAAEVDGLHEAFIAEVAKGIVIGIEVLFRHNSERADGCERAAVLAIQLVDTVAIDHQLALLAARQVEVMHQAVARIVVVPVALVVHARPFVTVIPLGTVARITPSSVRHRPSHRGWCCLGCP